MAMWGVITAEPAVNAAQYYLVLPTENIILYATELGEYMSPAMHNGDFEGFKNMWASGTPLIPVDTHHALLLDWVDMDRMARNRPYLDDAIKAAIALVA